QPARARSDHDADGNALFTPTEVVNVGVDPAQVTDLPALAAALSAPPASRPTRSSPSSRPRPPASSSR
ncbi:hypothetical protein, partial [Blastococcus sp. CCUG 61487]|uniref:hypothetical protein n=1 Tax=Blastococcus sp. CCUG 61487 TaxID=1840703 RepID=UPI00201DBE33